MKRLSLALAALVAIVALPYRTTAASVPIDGLWDAVIVAAGTEVPFRFEISTKGSDAQGFFFEGDRKVGSTSGTFTDGVLKLDYEFLNTALELSLKDDALTGTYRNNRAGARPQDVRMRRFIPVAVANDNTPSLAGTWEMRRNADEVTAPRDTRTWQVFLRQSGAYWTWYAAAVRGRRLWRRWATSVVS